jgi:hypothetical protein
MAPHGQVVLASWRIVKVNANSCANLSFALRGSGGGFGIVTRLDLATFDHDLMRGRFTIYPSDKNASIYEALENFNLNAPKDPSAAVIVPADASQAQYEHMNATTSPTILENFTYMATSRTSRVTHLYDLNQELATSQPNDVR